MKDESVLELLKDEHVDLLIRLAFEMEAYRKIEQLELDGDKAFSDEEKRIMEQALAEAYEKLKQQELNERRKQRAGYHRRRLMKGIEILACVVLIIAISTPVAVANFETLRQRLVEFLVSFDSVSETTSVVPLDEIIVPDDWEGKYFPSYLPRGTQVAEISPSGRTLIRFLTEDNAIIVFSENDGDCTINAGAEDETISMLEINGYQARVSTFPEEEHFIRIVWDNGERWFILETSNLEFKKAYAIAESIRKISD